MCGIAGALSSDTTFAFDEGRLRAATDLLKHRGPDGSSVWIEPGAALAHTRLAIIDRAHGEQPMFTADERYAVAFNGEIYNHRELRQELERSGCELRTNCDTEVLPYLYAIHGPEMASRLRGMFAVAIWDRQERTLFLARDRFGKKPLYFARSEGSLSFASTVDALAAIARIELRADPQALYEYLVLQYVPAPLAPFEGVTKLPPGHVAVWSHSGFDARPYWRPPRRGIEVEGGTPRSFGDADLRRLRETVADAVSARLESEVPLGIFLSGGLDSSVVVAEAASAGLRPRTFSVGFAKPEYDETRFARMVAERFRTDHTELVADDGVAEAFERFVAAYDEPFADSSALATLSVARAAAEHVTVVLTGDGGDEMFGGYERYALYRRAARLRERLGPLASVGGWAARGLGGFSGQSRVASAGRLLGAPWPWYRDALFHFTPADAFALLRPELAERVDSAEPVRRLNTLWGNGFGGISGLMFVDEHTYLPDDLLTKMDRATMAFGLEARSPLLDHGLAELVAGYPDSWLFAGGQGKAILREAYRPLLPPEILARPKMGFGVPIARWMRGDLRSHVERLLLSPDASVWQWLRFEEGSALVRRFLDGGEVPPRRVWNLLALAGWADLRLRRGSPLTTSRRS